MKDKWICPTCCWHDGNDKCKNELMYIEDDFGMRTNDCTGTLACHKYVKIEEDDHKPIMANIKRRSK